MRILGNDRRATSHGPDGEQGNEDRAGGDNVLVFGMGTGQPLQPLFESGFRELEAVRKWRLVEDPEDHGVGGGTKSPIEVDVDRVTPDTASAKISRMQFRDAPGCKGFMGELKQGISVRYRRGEKKSNALAG